MCILIVGLDLAPSSSPHCISAFLLGVWCSVFLRECCQRWTNGDYSKQMVSKYRYRGNAEIVTGSNPVHSLTISS